MHIQEHTHICMYIQAHKDENRLVVARKRGWEVGKMDEDSQKVQISSDKINKFWECNVQHSDYS